jgi:guanine deaminase
MNQLSPDNYRDESTDESIANAQASIDYIRKIDPNFSLVCPIITPRFAPSCSSDLLTRLGKLAKESNLPIQTHMSENLAEVALVKELFPGHESYAHVYDAHGLFTDRTILAHCVHISEEEVKLCAAKGAGIAHCPISNTGLTSGEAKVRWIIEGGVKVGLGTDCSGGYSPSILESARQASNVSRHVCMKSTLETKETPQLALAEILYLATMGGAEVCALQDRVGNFVVGKEFDALLIDPNAKGGNVDIFEEDAEDWDRVLSKWAFNGYFLLKQFLTLYRDDRNIQKVWVQGKLVAGQAM